MNQLSMKAYNHESNSGRLGKRRRMVYDILKCDAMTTKQILCMARLESPSIGVNSISGRITELVNMGLVECKNVVKDKDTGHSVSIWGIVRGATIKELPKKPSKDLIIQQLREENALLRDKIESYKPKW